MNRSHAVSLGQLCTSIAAVALIAASVPAAGGDGASMGPASYSQYGPQYDERYDGVLAESYQYHHQSGPSATIAPQNGWYHYGFPVSTYRWGWFGADHYYPWVWWHRGYNGDCVRCGYRCGY